MTQEVKPAPVVVELERRGDDVQWFSLGAKSMPEMTIDWSHLTKEERDKEHYGARFLCAAALACFCNTFYNALKRGGAKVKSLKAKATIRKEKDSILRTRYTQIVLEMEVGLDEADGPIFESVKEELDLGSLVTYSLPEGIQVEHDLRMA